MFGMEQEMLDSYRWGNHTGMNMTPRNPQDLAGLSATNTVPVPGGGAHSCVYPGGHNGINNVRFIVETDPTALDPLHFLIVLQFNPWHLTMAQWAASRAHINNQNQATWLAPTITLFNLAQLFFVTQSKVVGAATATSPFDGVPHVNRSRVRLLWHMAYWDGPLTGLAQFEGQHCWFAVPEPDTAERGALLYPLDESEWLNEKKKHQRFQRFVGRHTDYDALGKRSIGDVLPSEAWPHFFEEQTGAVQDARGSDYIRRPAIAWFSI